MSHFVRYFLFAALFGTHFHLYAENLSGHSFLTAQPFSTISSDMTYSMIMDQYQEQGSVLNKPQIQTTFVWGKSCDSAGLAEYFLFNNKLRSGLVLKVHFDEIKIYYSTIISSFSGSCIIPRSSEGTNVAIISQSVPDKLN